MDHVRTRSRARARAGARAGVGRRRSRSGRSILLVAAALVAVSCAPGGTARDGSEDSATASPIVLVHLVRSGPSEAYVEPTLLHVGEAPEDLTAAVRSAVQGLLVLTTDERGAAVSPVQPDLTSYVPAGIALLDVSIADGVVTVDLGGELLATSGTAAEERILTQQFAHTALLDDALTALRILVDGAPITRLWGHLDWSSPLTADRTALSPIMITEPGPATTRSGDPTMTVSGEAAVPKGRLLVHLEDAAGTIVTEAAVTATEAAPGRGTWDWEVRLPGPGTWTIVARSTDSDGRGIPPFETRRSTTYER